MAASGRGTAAESRRGRPGQGKDGRPKIDDLRAGKNQGGHLEPREKENSAARESMDQARQEGQRHAPGLPAGSTRREDLLEHVFVLHDSADGNEASTGIP